VDLIPRPARDACRSKLCLWLQREAACGAEGVMARGRGCREGARGAQGVDYAPVPVAPAGGGVIVVGVDGQGRPTGEDVRRLLEQLRQRAALDTTAPTFQISNVLSRRLTFQAVQIAPSTSNITLPPR